MNSNQLRSPQHETIRTVLRVGGPILVAAGIVFIAISLISFFSAMGSFGQPRFFWCWFIGIPLFAVGFGMCKFGYLGDIARYISAESSPVAKDTANYLGEGMQPGVKAVAKAITEGVLEAQQGERGES